jgi:hypothetical protein
MLERMRMEISWEMTNRSKEMETIFDDGLFSITFRLARQSATPEAARRINGKTMAFLQHFRG